MANILAIVNTKVVSTKAVNTQAVNTRLTIAIDTVIKIADIIRIGTETAIVPAVDHRAIRLFRLVRIGSEIGHRSVWTSAICTSVARMSKIIPAVRIWSEVCSKCAAITA